MSTISTACPDDPRDELVKLRAELEIEQAKTDIQRLKSERRQLEDLERWQGPRSDERPEAENPGPKLKTVKPRDLTEAMFIGTVRSLTEAYSDYVSYTGTGWGALVDPLDAYTDVDGFLLPSAGIADRRTNATSLLTPLIRNELQLLMVRGAARLLLDMNQFAIGVLENLVAFQVGEGMPCKAAWRKGQGSPSDDLPAKIQEDIDHFYDVWAYDEFQQELVWRLSRDGETFLQFEQEELDSGFRTPELDMQVMEPEFVTQEGAPQDVDPHTGFDAWSWGIHTKHLRPAKALEYNLKPWSAVGNYQIDAQHIDHVKVNVDRNLKRGIPDFAPVADGLEGCRKLVRNTREGAAVQAAIAGIWEYDGTPMANVQGAVTQNRDAYRAYNPSPVTGKQINYQKVEPGTFVHAPKSKQFKPLTQGQSNTPGFVQAVQMALRGVAVRWGMPEYIVSADASNGNFASILVAGSPFVRQILRRQRFLKRRFEATLWRVVYAAWKAKRYGDVPWGYIYKAIELQLEAPKPQIADRVQEAQASEIEHRNGVLSTQTWRMRQGLDNDTEVENFKKEPPPQQPQQPGKEPQSPLASLMGGDQRDDYRESIFPSQQRVREGEDASGHQHKGKGPGGGQFTSQDGGGGGSAKKTATKDKSAEKAEPTSGSKDAAVKAKPKAVKGEMTAARREGTGKEARIVLADGSAAPAHIKPSMVPPDWTDVKISTDPHADVLVQAKDKKGNAKTVYSDGWNMKAQAAKFSRIHDALHEMPSMNEQVQRDRHDPKKAGAADCTWLMQEQGTRPGSEADNKGVSQLFGHKLTAEDVQVSESDKNGIPKVSLKIGGKDVLVRDKKARVELAKRKQNGEPIHDSTFWLKSHGATTLEGRHVVQLKDGVHLQFMGKESVWHDHVIHNPDLAAMLLERKKAAGDGGKLFGVSDGQVSAYAKTLDHGGFSPKDWRTARATRMAIEEINGMEAPTTEKEYRTAAMTVAKKVSGVLGNEPAQALESYISPTVFSGWRAGLG